MPNPIKTILIVCSAIFFISCTLTRPFLTPAQDTPLQSNTATESSEIIGRIVLPLQCSIQSSPQQHIQATTETSITNSSLSLLSTLTAPSISADSVQNTTWLTFSGQLDLGVTFNQTLSELDSLVIRVSMQAANGLSGQTITQSVLPVQIVATDNSKTINLTNSQQDLFTLAGPFTTAILATSNYYLKINLQNAIAQNYAGTLVIELVKQYDEASFITKTYSQGPADNPLKGFMPYVEENHSLFPHSLEFFYIPLNEVLITANTYSFDAVNATLNAVAGRARQAVFRVYIDYPTKATALPQFLIDQGVTFNNYTDYGGGQSPNYENQNLVDALLAFIAKLGETYDGDARIGFIQLGLLGFWGEWHTYRDSTSSDDWMPNDTIRNQILQAFDNAFNQTKLVLRYPITNSTYDIGYHDDMFAKNTLNTIAWHFLGRMSAANQLNKWQTSPIGGEVAPAEQQNVWKDPLPASAEVYNDCVDQTHISWMLNNRIFWDTSFTAEESARITAGAKRLGYDLFIHSSRIVSLGNSQYDIRIKIQNKGVAPFYYAWTVQIAALNSSNAITKTIDTDWNITDIMPDETETFQHTIDLSDQTSGTYKILVKGKNPLSGGKDINWANQTYGDDQAGWLTLGDVTQ